MVLNYPALKGLTAPTNKNTGMGGGQQDQHFLTQGRELHRLIQTQIKLSLACFPKFQMVGFWTEDDNGANRSCILAQTGCLTSLFNFHPVQPSQGLSKRWGWSAHSAPQALLSKWSSTNPSASASTRYLVAVLTQRAAGPALETVTFWGARPGGAQRPTPRCPSPSRVWYHS